MPPNLMVDNMLASRVQVEIPFKSDRYNRSA